MKNSFTMLIGIVVALVLLGYMFSYQVRYNEVAVKTTFEQMTAASKKDPGFHLRFPWPIDKVTKYTTQVQILESQLEEQQTKDGRAVIIRTYLAWRISDPLQFYKAKLETTAEGERKLLPLLREIGSVISAYNFEEMVNVDKSRLKLGEIETAAQKLVTDQLALHQYGISVEQVGIRRILLPESVTESVFDNMRKTRDRMAAKAQQEGDAQAAAIISRAESAKKRILAFSQRTAEAIRARGDAEASSHYGVFTQNTEFAIFLRKIEALKAMLANNTTFVLDANSVDMLKWFNQEPRPSTGASTAGK